MYIALLQNKKRKGEELEAEEDMVYSLQQVNSEVLVFFQIKAPELPGGKRLTT